MLCFVVSLFLVLLGFGHLSTKLGTLNLDANTPDDSDLSESTSGESEIQILNHQGIWDQFKWNFKFLAPKITHTITSGRDQGCASRGTCHPMYQTCHPLITFNSSSLIFQFTKIVKKYSLIFLQTKFLKT